MHPDCARDKNLGLATLIIGWGWQENVLFWRSFPGLLVLEEWS